MRAEGTAATPRKVSRKATTRALTRVRAGGRAARLACAALLLSGLATGSASAQYSVRVTQQDTTKFPHIRVFLSITDESGNPISTTEPVTLKIFEDDVLVKEQSLSGGGGAGEGHSVLVLDLSDSMEGEKLAQARAAAVDYINVVPPGFRIAVVKFGRTASAACSSANGRSPFTSDRGQLRTCINSLQDTMGRTALQEGIGLGLDLLRGKAGRRDVIALTDGYENSTTKGPYQGPGGLEYLLRRATSEEATISVVGLGPQVNESDLSRYEETKGKYWRSPTSAQLAAVFRQAAKVLGSEYMVEYDTSASDPDGTRGKIRPKLVVGKTEVSGIEAGYVRPGLLPHVRGEHFWFIIALPVLIVLPKWFSLLGAIYAVWRFRARHVRRLEQGSAYLGRRDTNYDASHGPFQIGDLIVVCPASNTPYYVRSWRMYKCQCGREPLCAGHFCYHRVLPQWARSALNKLFNNHEGRAGRSWLCHCAGDKHGY